MITHEELLELLHYDKDTGGVRWKKANNSRIKAGSIAGSVHKKGHNINTINNKNYNSARLAWFYINKEWPKGEVTHINNIKCDDRICNLKNVSLGSRVRKRNVNPCYDKRYNKWQSSITLYKKRIYLGRFDTEQEAKDAITNYKLKLEESGIL